MNETRLQPVQVEHLPRAMRELILKLLVGQGLDAAKCTLILEQLLRYARVWQRSWQEGGDVAVIGIGNLLKLHRQDHWSCCCYQTAHTFLRILCALGILRRHTGTAGATEYHLPLTPEFVFQPTADMLAELNRLSDPARTRNKRVRDKASDVKSRLLLLYASAPLVGPASVVREDADLSELTGSVRAALLRVERLLGSVGALDVATKRQLLAGIGTVLAELLKASRKSTLSVDSLSAATHLTWGQAVDSVDSRDHEANGESTDLVDSQPGTAQNLPASKLGKGTADKAHKAGLAASSDTQNLPADGGLVDSGAAIDNGSHISSNISSSPLPQNKKKTIIVSSDIDGNTTARAGDAPKQKQSPLPGCDTFRSGEARDLARFIEQHGNNFRAYIALSKTCSRGAIRAAVVNMVAHRYFPDLDGSLDGALDGEITGKWGRPKRPGAWVTDLARAYQQSGIPGVMEELLDSLKDADRPFSYQRVEETLSELAQRIAPEQFWRALQQLLCEDQAAAELRDGSAAVQPTLPLEVGKSMSAAQASALVSQIALDGGPYGISAQPRCVGGTAWVADVQIEATQADGQQGMQAFTMEVRSEEEWLTYFNGMKELEG